MIIISPLHIFVLIIPSIAYPIPAPISLPLFPPSTFGLFVVFFFHHDGARSRRVLDKHFDSSIQEGLRRTLI